MKKTFTQQGALALLTLFLLLPLSCEKDEEVPANSLLTYKTADFNAEVATEWFRLATELIRTTNGYTPPVAARALGYMGVALYESVVPGMEGYQSLAGQVTELRPQDLPLPDASLSYYWPLVANAALATVTDLLFPDASPTNKFLITSLRSQYEAYFRNQLNFEVTERSIEYGKSIGQAIFAWAAKDPVGHEAQNKNFPADYVVPTGEGKWVPTGAQFIPLQPYWGRARTFVPNCAAETQPGPPMAFSTAANSPFHQQAQEVYTVSKNLTQEEKTIALYWADGGGTITPPGHSVSVAVQLIQAEKLSLDKAAVLLARMGMAVNDAFVSCWSCKFIHNILRPETYIREYIDRTWKPLIATPPFPEYTSGHSTQSGAAAVVLSGTFGENYPFTDQTHQNRTDINGTPRKFSNFMAAANEAAISRLYGGIHYRSGNDNGLAQGIRVGQHIMGIKFERK